MAAGWIEYPETFSAQKLINVGNSLTYSLIANSKFSRSYTIPTSVPLPLVAFHNSKPDSALSLPEKKIVSPNTANWTADGGIPPLGPTNKSLTICVVLSLPCVTHNSLPCVLVVAMKYIFPSSSTDSLSFGNEWAIPKLMSFTITVPC